MRQLCALAALVASQTASIGIAAVRRLDLTKNHKLSLAVHCHYGLLFLIAGLLSISCGGARKAEPAEVEIQWPDAAVLKTGQVTLPDAGIAEATLPEEADAMPTP